MSRINTLSLEHATDTTRPLLEGVQKKSVFCPMSSRRWRRHPPCCPLICNSLRPSVKRR